jgi:hypothetical protein
MGRNQEVTAKKAKKAVVAIISNEILEKSKVDQERVIQELFHDVL